jgi:hypothetical protein
MKPPSTPLCRPRRKSMLRRCVKVRLKARHPQHRAKEIQLIYAHFAPPVAFSVTEYPGYVRKPGKEFIDTGSGSRRDAIRARWFTGRRPGVNQTSLASVRKRTQL